MSKHLYHILLESIGEAGSESASIGFDFENHDDVFRIIDIMKSSGRFQDEQQAIQFAVGLKLLGDVMMKNRSNELFKDFEPAFVDFMKKVKNH